MRASFSSITAAFATVVAVSACARQPAASIKSADPRINHSVEQVRAATKAFHDLDAAVAAGYAREVPTCFVHEHHGAMGYHHVNRAYMDGVADVEKPEILLYQRMPDGKYQLNGVEFIVPYRAWARDSIPPTVMGQTMKREDNMKYWYLHAWVWKNNPDGIFADFHPDVTCPEEGRKVYTPSSSSDQ